MAPLFAMEFSSLAIMLSLFQYTLSAPANLAVRQSTVPSFALDYAPMVWLYSQETYNPGDLQVQIDNTQPEVNFSVVSNASSPLTLDNLNALNNLGGANVYLTSTVSLADNPTYLNGVKPNSVGETVGAKSCTIIINDHGGSSTVDVYFLYFYNYNRGDVIFGDEFGDHVGDWEHNMIRFENGVPSQLWYSQHQSGEAFTYGATEKIGQRPVSYSGNGTHANFAISGEHDHTLEGLNIPFLGPLIDYTDQGTLWDPTLSAYIYNYDFASNTYTAYNGEDPVNWLYFLGAWGDEQYPTSNPIQSEPLGISLLAKYTGGPTGPYDKDLNRTNVCPDSVSPCVVSPILRPKKL